MRSTALAIGLSLVASGGAMRSHGQASAPPPPADSAPGPSAEALAGEQDHKHMMERLGITGLRQKRGGKPGEANPANYDPAQANPFPELPDPLTLKNGQKVTTPQIWWTRRRPEIVDEFDREVYGRIPKDAPKVSWSVVSKVTDGRIGSLPANGREIVGHVDNSAFPEVTVEIRMILVTPAHAETQVPVLMMFSRAGANDMPRAADAEPPPPDPKLDGPTGVPPSTEQLLAAGWGYALLDPISIQLDNGAGLSQGVIGLSSKGEPRKPEDWGALRAWAWGASRALDHLETYPSLDAQAVGIEGVSRFGKAALVAMAFDERFAIALIGSSGKGGATLLRRDFGEGLENLVTPRQSHWMAGNLMNYAAAESSSGGRNAGDLPVDSHELIALCAPRPVFISYGAPEGGDIQWLDQEGSYMAAVAAGPVFRLLGASDLGEKAGYRDAKMPPVNTGLLNGQLAWRQHDGGHEDRSNMRYFIQWANEQLEVTPAAQQTPAR